jgi:hypothetical protein
VGKGEGKERDWDLKNEEREILKDSYESVKRIVEQSQNEAYQYITDLNCFRIGFKCNGF